MNDAIFRFDTIARMRRGQFLTLEGSDGVGKSTQARMLESWLKARGRRVVLTREPGGGRVSEQIRRILLDPVHDMEMLTELMLYESARVEHLRKVIVPALERGRFVICDRFTDSTIAYQGFARGLDLKMIETLNKIATGNLSPDLTILLDLPAKEGLRKARSRKGGGKGDRLEKEGVRFQEKVRRGFLALARRYPARIKKVAVQSTADKTQELIRSLIARRLKV